MMPDAAISLGRDTFLAASLPGKPTFHHGALFDAAQ
jgi:hypothetical protein